MGWLLWNNASSEIIGKHINKSHHQKIKEWNVGGSSLQSKEQIGGGIFSKIWFPVSIFDSTDNFQVKALWFSFSGLLQEELNFIMEHWNTRTIRKIDSEPFLVAQMLFITYQNILGEHQT